MPTYCTPRSVQVGCEHSILACRKTAPGSVWLLLAQWMDPIIKRFFNVSWGYQVFEYQNLWQGKGRWFCAMEKWPGPFMPEDHCGWQQFSVHFALARGCHFVNNFSLWLFTFSRWSNDFISQMSVLFLWYWFHLVVKLLIYRSLLSECKQILVLKALIMHNVWILISSPS